MLKHCAVMCVSHVKFDFSDFHGSPFPSRSSSFSAGTDHATSENLTSDADSSICSVGDCG